MSAFELKSSELTRGPKWLRDFLNKLREDVKTARSINGENTHIDDQQGEGQVINVDDSQ